MVAMLPRTTRRMTRLARSATNRFPSRSTAIASTAFNSARIAGPSAVLRKRPATVRMPPVSVLRTR